MKKFRYRIQRSPDEGGIKIYTPGHGNMRVSRDLINRQSISTAAPNAYASASGGNEGILVNPTTLGINVPGGGVMFEDQALQANVNVMPIPPAFTVIVTSVGGVGANALTRIFLFNETQAGLGNEVTDNGSGAGSITYNYEDGFNGRQISKAMANARMGVGQIMFGFSMRFDSFAAATPSVVSGNAFALNSAKPKFVTYNGFGPTEGLNTNFTTTTNQTRGDFDTSIEVIPSANNMTDSTQFSFLMPADATAAPANTNFVATCTFYTTPNFKK